MASPRSDCRGSAPFSAATWLLLGSAIVFSVLFYLFVNEYIFKPGIRTVPTQDAPVITEPEATESRNSEAEPAQAPMPSVKDMELSVDEVIGFDEPPMFPPKEPEQQSELQRTLTREQPDDRVHISGQLFIDDDASLRDPKLEDIDGAEIEVEVGIE